MARKKTLKEPQLISLQVEKEDYNKFKCRVGSVSQHLREHIHNYVNLDNNLNDLKLELNNKIIERDNLNLEIEMLQSKIKELETTLKENEKNNNLILELMETIKTVSKNIYNNEGITKDRIKAIANNKINPTLLIKECKKQGIKIIKESEITTSNIKPNNKGVEKSEVEKMAIRFFREFNNQHNKIKYKDNKKAFLNDKSINKKYKAMCKNKVDFKEFETYILNHD